MPEQQPVSLWDKRFSKDTEPKKGPLFEEAQSLRTIVGESVRLNILHQDKKKGHYTNVVSLYDVPTQYNSNDSVGAQTDVYGAPTGYNPNNSVGTQNDSVGAQIKVLPNDPSLYLALTHKNDEKAYYTIDGDGCVVNHDMIYEGGGSTGFVEPKSDELKTVSNVMGQMSSRMEDVNRHERANRMEKKRKRRNKAITATVLAAAIGGGYLGVKAWIIEPHEAAERYRATYDTKSYNLPGEGAPIDGRSFNVIPVSQFNEIPEFGGSDRDLDNPRTIVLREDSYNNICATVEANVPADADLYVALPEGDTYAAHMYQTSHRNEKSFSICLTEMGSEDNEQQNVEVALQVRQNPQQ